MSVHLPVVATRRRELETCGYCPKLCRSACPVSTASHSETLTPWGKMTGVWQSGLGHTSIDREHAGLAWACSGCLACRTLCDHKNPVVETLLEARADFFERGLAPENVVRAAGKHAQRAAQRRQRADLVRPGREHSRPETTLLIGCVYLERFPSVAADIVRVAEHLLGPVRVSSECCGAPALHAGDREGYRVAQARLANDYAGSALVAVDPGCARALSAPYTLLLSHVERALVSLSQLTHASARAERDELAQLRWHDPCNLGRGLGQYQAPRAILERLLGHAPLEFRDTQESAHCSGAGGGLPLYDPHAARQIAARRVAEHEACGGGGIVTGCASSLKQFLGQGSRALDLFTLVRRGLVP